MKKVITAMCMSGLNKFLDTNTEIKILNNDIEYQEELFNQLAVQDLDVLIVTDNLPGMFSKYELIDEILKINKEFKVIVFIKELEDRAFLRFLKEKGIKDIVDNDSNIEDELVPSILFDDKDEEKIRQLVESASEVEKEVAATVEKHKKVYIKKEIVTIATPGGGGVGKTTIAINLAVLLAKKNNISKVVLVDFNEEKADIARSLELNEELGLEGLVKSVMTNELNEKNILKSIQAYNNISNLFVLSGIKNEVNIDSYNLIHYKKIIDVLSNKFDYLIIDTGNFKSNATHVSLEKATKLVFVVRDLENNLAALNKKLKLYNDVVGIDLESKYEIFLNMSIGNRELNLETIEEIFSRRPIANIKIDPLISTEMEKYKPIVLNTNNKNLKKINKSYEDVVDKLFEYKLFDKKSVFKKYLLRRTK